MIVCICRNVSDKDIQRCVDNGCGFDEIMFETGACTDCQKCKDSIRLIIEEAKSNAGLE